MKVRAASIRDLGRVEQLYSEAESRMPHAAPPVRLWSLLSKTLSALLPLTQETLLYVCDADGRLAGFIQASSLSPAISLPGATSLQVLNLCVDDVEDVQEAAQALVEHLCEQALLRGVHSLFVRLPVDDPLTPIFRLEGFRQYATELVVYSESPAGRGTGPLVGVRPARGRDDRVLYQLYRKVTPMGVVQVEAPTYSQWRGLKNDWTQPSRSRGDSEVEQVVDRVELVAWLRVHRSAGAEPHTLSFLTLPETPLPQELADHALGIIGDPPGPAWSSLRHYDSLMIDALYARGFSTLVHQGLMVKDLAVRVPVREKGLVPIFG